MSGVVMLTMGVAQDVDDSNVYDEQWNNDVRDLVNKCKPNVLTSYDHRGTKYFMYSFGNEPIFGKNMDHMLGFKQAQ